MNPLAQPDIHPDADSLNAFVEQMLPEAERAQIVAHMSGCSRCREVVYLVHAAAGDEPEAALAVGARPASRRGWWTPTWRMAWIPAAALAAVSAIVIWTQLKPAPRTTIAQLAQQPSAQTTTPPPPAAINQALAALDQATPLPPKAAAQRAEPRKSKGAIAGQTQEAGGETLGKPLPQASQMPAPGVQSAEDNAISLSRLPPTQEVPVAPAMAPLQPAQADAKLQPPQPAEKSQIVARRAMAAAPAPPPPNMLAVHSAVAAPAPAAGGPAPLAVQPLPQLQLKLSPQPLNTLTASRLARRPRLPSGLNAVSTAALRSRLIAVDSNGAVFLSQDAGKPWEPVPPQWDGKAIEVHAEPRTADEFGSATESITLFKLVTDRHQAWISEDGKIWRQQ